MEDATLEQTSNDSVDVETIDTSVSETLIAEETVESVKSNESDIGIALQPPEIDYESIGEFCFESDTLALKGNNDYKNLLEALVILEAQRERAVKDLDELLQLQEEALADPFSFVERLQKKEKINIPTPQRVHPVPSIDWGKYALSGDPSAFRHRQLARIAADVKQNSKRKSYDLIESQELPTDNWTPEEEKYLKKLLIQFPPEKYETARWEKIANCLRNRSSSEVASKAKKCFSEIVDGDFEDEASSTTYSKKMKSTHVNQLQSNFINNEMNKYQDSSNVCENFTDSKVDISDDEDISPDLHDTAEYQELLLYKRLLRKRIKSSTMTQHLGYKCSLCKTEPIIGIRYHCRECKPPLTIDFCEECAGNSYEIGPHVSDHQLEEIQYSNSGFLDHDYMHFLGNDYNYLDPNYMPVT